MSLALVLRAVAEGVRAERDALNRLDGQAGDGDLGVTMGTAAQLVLELLPGVEAKTPAEILKACGLSLARGAPSTAGTLVATGLLRAGKAAEVRAAGDAATLAALLDAARAGIAERGKAEAGSKTMLDALIPACAAASAAAAGGESLQQALERAATAADAGARATVDMRPLHGRAGWLVERSAGHEDAGARLVAIALRLAADATAGPAAA